MEKQGFKEGDHGYVPSNDMAHYNKSSEVDLTDEGLKAAWDRVTKDQKKDKTTWCGFGFEDKEASTKLVCLGTGEGGLSELKKKLHEWSNKIIFGAFAVHCTDKEHGSPVPRPKFVSFVYAGAGVSEYDRAAVNFQKGKVRPFFGSVHLSLDMRGPEIDTLYVLLSLPPLPQNLLLLLPHTLGKTHPRHLQVHIQGDHEADGHGLRRAQAFPLRSPRTTPLLLCCCFPFCRLSVFCRSSKLLLPRPSLTTALARLPNDAPRARPPRTDFLDGTEIPVKEVRAAAGDEEESDEDFD